MARTVERLLGVRVVERVDLGSSELAPVARLILDRFYDGIGRTVIAKGRRLAEVGGRSGTEFLRNEKLALEHLRGTDLAPTIRHSASGSRNWPGACSCAGKRHANHRAGFRPSRTSRTNDARRARC